MLFCAEEQMKLYDEILTSILALYIARDDSTLLYEMLTSRRNPLDKFLRTF